MLSEGEVVLLESVAHHGKRLPNGRFLTMHKRRRKKLTTRSLSNENAPALLDDIHHGQVQVSIMLIKLPQRCHDIDLIVISFQQRVMRLFFQRVIRDDDLHHILHL